ncbi:hypothetical protein D3C71_1278890 [compost metagenome]
MQNRQCGDVVGLTGQLDVRVTANHAGGRAWRVQQDALERFAIPPRLGVATVGGNQFGAQFQAFEVLPHSHQTLGFEVHRHHAGQSRLGFEDMASLAARRTAGVEHSLARRQIEQIGGQLRGFVLHADPAFGEAWQAAHVGGGFEDDAVAAVNAWCGGDAGVGQQAEVSIAAVMAAVDSQDHRRVRIVRRADGFPLLWPECLQGFLQPARVGGAHHRIAFQFGENRFAFALSVTQHGVEQGFGPRLFQLVGATDGFADGGMGRNAGVEQLVEADQQQRLDIGVSGLEWFLQQLGRQRRQTRLPASGAERQILGETAITVLDLVQLRRQRAVERSFSAQDSGECLGGGQTRVH